MVGQLLKRWVLVAVAVPLAAAGARKLSQTMERRRGSSRMSRLLQTGAETLRPARARRRGGLLRSH